MKSEINFPRVTILVIGIFIIILLAGCISPKEMSPEEQEIYKADYKYQDSIARIGENSQQIENLFSEAPTETRLLKAKVFSVAADDAADDVKNWSAQIYPLIIEYDNLLQDTEKKGSEYQSFISSDSSEYNQINTKISSLKNQNQDFVTRYNSIIDYYNNLYSKDYGSLPTIT